MKADIAAVDPLTVSRHGGCGGYFSAQKAAEHAVELAIQAARAGTFGVGGFLVDRWGRVLQEARNDVVRDGCVHDPTAHAERRLVAWYQARRLAAPNSVPPPNQVTVVTSLEPCMMCAGSILQSGLNCVALAGDEVAGVTSRGDFNSLPSQLRPFARDRIGFLGVSGKGGSGPARFLGTVDADMVHRAKQVFLDTIDSVKAEFDVCAAGDDVDANEAAVREVLTQLSDVEGDTELLGPANEVLLRCAPAATDSVTASALMRLIRRYSLARRVAAARTGIPLPHPRRCRIRCAAAPALDARFVTDFGAIGSFLEGPAERTPYVLCGGGAYGPNAVNAALDAFPPLYSEIIGLSVKLLDVDCRWPPQRHLTLGDLPRVARPCGSEVDEQDRHARSVGNVEVERYSLFGGQT